MHVWTEAISNSSSSLGNGVGMGGLHLQSTPSSINYSALIRFTEYQIKQKRNELKEVLIVLKQKWVRRGCYTVFLPMNGLWYFLVKTLKGTDRQKQVYKTISDTLWLQGNVLAASLIMPSVSLQNETLTSCLIILVLLKSWMLCGAAQVLPDHPSIHPFSLSIFFCAGSQRCWCFLPAVIILEVQDTSWTSHSLQ